MAWLELDQSGIYLIGFRFGGIRFKKSLGTQKKTEAVARLHRLEENIKLVDEGRLVLPETGSISAFLLSDGKLNAKPQLRRIQLGELYTSYRDSLPHDALEPV